ncbi:MAG: hypothetical protein AAF805_01380 [Planctomycetota bacterium]
MPAVADALDLLLDADSLRDDGVAAWLLDLRSAPPQFATPQRSVVRRVADRFAARVAAGHDAVLGVASGLLTPTWAAALAAEALAAVGQPQTPVAVVRGEDVTGELEAWHAAGESLAHAQTGEPLFDTTAEPITAAAPPGAEPLRRLRDTGARVIVAEFASPDAFAEAFGDAAPVAAATTRRHVLVWLEQGWRLDATFRFADGAGREAAEQQVSRLASSLGVRSVCSRFQDADSLRLSIAAEAERPGVLRDFGDLIPAVAPHGEGTVVEGLPPAPRRVTRLWPTDVAAERVRYAADVRPASEWRDELSTERFA